MEEITEINLSSIPTLLINLENAKDRFSKASDVLSKAEQPFTRFEAVKHEIGVVGCALSHLSLLDKIQPLTMVLEDDIETTAHIKKSIAIPRDADAIYLGVSNHGYLRNQKLGFKGAVLVSQYSENYLRVLNMCSTHAIIYLSQRYIDASKKIINHCLHAGIAFDVGLASIHRHFNIVTPTDPWFFQSEQPEFTNFSLQL